MARAKALTRPITRKQARSYTQTTPNRRGVTALAELNGRGSYARRYAATRNLLANGRQGMYTAAQKRAMRRMSPARRRTFKKMLDAACLTPGQRARHERKLPKRRTKARKARPNRTRKQAGKARSVRSRALKRALSTPAARKTATRSRPLKGAFIAAQRRRGRSAAQAEAAWRLAHGRHYAKKASRGRQTRTYGKYKAARARIGRKSRWTYKTVTRGGKVRDIPDYALLGFKSKKAYLDVVRDIGEDVSPKRAKRARALDKRRSRLAARRERAARKAAARIRAGKGMFTPNASDKTLSYQEWEEMIRPNRRRKKTTANRRRRKTSTRRRRARANRPMSKSRRSTAAKKAAATRKRNKAKRSRAAKKAARTRKRTTTKRRASTRRRSTTTARRKKTASRRKKTASRRKTTARRRRRARPNYWVDDHRGHVKAGKLGWRRKRRKSRKSKTGRRRARRNQGAYMVNRRRRHYRRNQSSFTNQLMGALKLGALVTVGYVSHRALTKLFNDQILSRAGTTFTQGTLGKFRGSIAGTIVAALGIPLAVKVAPKQAVPIAAGMAASLIQGLLVTVLGELGQGSAAQYLSAYPNAEGRAYGSYYTFTPHEVYSGYGRPFGSYYTLPSMSGFGMTDAQLTQAAAGYGASPQLTQAAAGYGASPQLTQAAAGYGMTDAQLMQAAAGMGQALLTQAAAGTGEYIAYGANAIGEYDEVQTSRQGVITDEGIYPNLHSAEQALSVAEAAAGIGNADVPLQSTVNPSVIADPLSDLPGGSRAGVFTGGDGIFGGGACMTCTS